MSWFNAALFPSLLDVCRTAELEEGDYEILAVLKLRVACYVRVRYAGIDLLIRASTQETGLDHTRYVVQDLRSDVHC